MDFILNDLDNENLWPNTSDSEKESSQDSIKSSSKKSFNLTENPSESENSEDSQKMNEYFSSKFSSQNLKESKKAESKQTILKSFTSTPKTLLKSKTPYEHPENLKDRKVKEIKRTSLDEEKASIIILTHEENLELNELQRKIEETKNETQELLTKSERDLKQRNQEEIFNQRKKFDEIFKNFISFDHIQEDLGKKELNQFEGRIFEIAQEMQIIENEIVKRSQEIQSLKNLNRESFQNELKGRENFLNSLAKKVSLEKRVQKIMSLSLEKKEKYLRNFYEKEMNFVKISMRLAKDSHKNFTHFLNDSIGEYTMLISQVKEKQELLKYKLESKRKDKQKRFEELMDTVRNKEEIFKHQMIALYSNNKDLSSLKEKLDLLESNLKIPRKNYEKLEKDLKIRTLEVEGLEISHKELQSKIKNLETEIHEMKNLIMKAEFEIPHKIKTINYLKLSLENENHRLLVSESRITEDLKKVKNFQASSAYILKRTQGTLYNFSEDFHEVCEVLNGALILEMNEKYQDEENNQDEENFEEEENFDKNDFS